MPVNRTTILSCALLIALFAQMAFASGGPVVSESADDASLRLVTATGAADLCVDPQDHRVVQIAAGLLADDIERVTGQKPRIAHDSAKVSPQAVLIGTLGRSRVIDGLVSSGKLDAAAISGKWESFLLQVVNDPLPGIETALVIAGSDRRGTAYGVFELSERIGVSPWYFWADVPPQKKPALYVKPGRHVVGPPSVKYRGIFINDEDWGLQPWAAKTYDPQFGDLGPKTYERVFELLLRLRGNHLWPAMHGCTIEFGKVQGNIKAADDWAIVMGAAHCEPLNRNNVWWKQDGKGEWRYDTNRPNVMAYWEEWAQKRGDYEAVWTVGMRGIHDTGMPGPTDINEQVKLLEKAIDDQRDLLKKHVDPNVEQIPQVFTPYKEALSHYQAGLELPEDVTILWCEDNYGYIRQLSSPAEQKRSGGSGVYYHISYLGWPRPYLWLNTTPPALIWEEMTKAYDYGADQIWMLNVGDIKPGEIGTEFWLKLAWDVKRYGPDAQAVFLREWAARDFGPAEAGEIADIMGEYYQLNFQRKPELMDENVFSAVHYDEWRRRMDAFESLLARSESVNAKLPAEQRDAFYQLVLYPVRMSAWVNEAFGCADLSRLYAQQGRIAANAFAQRSEKAVKRIEAETAYFNNELAGAKWKHMMPVKGIGGGWNLQWPSVDRVKPTPKPHLGVAVQGSGIPLLPENVRDRGGVLIDLAAADGKFAKPFEKRTEDGVTFVIVPNAESGRSAGNALEPGTGAKAHYSFEVPSAGEYNLFMLANCPTNNDDSWFIRIDDGKWIGWNDVTTRGTWEWKKQGTHRLSAGKHTLTIAHREDGAGFSRIRITPRPSAQRLEEMHPEAKPEQLPTFNRYTGKQRFVELFNTSDKPLSWRATTNQKWIKLSSTAGELTDQQRVSVEIDWPSVPKGENQKGTITFEAGDQRRTVNVIANSPQLTESDAAPFVEEAGYVSIEAEHFTRSSAGGGDAQAKWTAIPDLGRTGPGAIAVLPTTVASDADVQGNPSVEYDLTLLDPADELTVTTYCLPTHRIHEGRGLRYAIAIDDEKPQIVDFYEAGGHGGEQSPRWRDNVSRNAAINLTRHGRRDAGKHTLRIWMVDPGVVIDKIVVDAGGLKDSQLGPPETKVNQAG